jgi:hypothetical protein
MNGGRVLVNRCQLRHKLIELFKNNEALDGWSMGVLRCGWGFRINGAIQTVV